MSGAGVSAGAPPPGPHCGIRLLALLAFAAALPALPLSALWLAGLVALLWLRRHSITDARFFLNGLWRLRWLFFAIVALHLWRGGGDPIWPTLPGLTDMGASEALRRCGVLVALLGAVVVLTRRTPPAWLAAGIIWLLAPLRALGVPVSRFARRLAMVFAAVDGARSEAAGLRQQGEGLDTAAARLLLRAEHGALAGEQIAEIPYAGRPGAGDMIFLSMLLGAVILLYLA
ncbi:hypothetical protein [Algiphilus aromaticivorans]|uniref:hypothetical protein n=1 Tax=Algiphilus aromaticivorans TaxID=382454 RepID=UPI0005C184F8|nr:hypothetical protein [Algiphilus aromaticivorans]